MNHNTLVIEIKSTLDKLIAARTSLGYDYIVYGLLLINEDQTRVSNITKALYIDIAAHYETSWSCVEKNIRNTVNANLDLRKQDYSRNDFQQNLY